ncbi:MAG: hypothetical protein RIF37_00665 [Rhodospirillaceae bacterium]
MKIPIVSGLLTRLKSGTHTTNPLSVRRVTEKSSKWSDDSLDLALGTLLADKESKSYGVVQAITLNQFREDLGDLWEQHQKSIFLIAETTIDRMLGKGQTAIQEDEYSWLLITPDLTQSEAASFAEHIAATIGEKLVGARFEANDDSDLTPQTSAIDLTTALSKDGSINKEAIQKAVAEARAIIARRNKRIRQTKPLTASNTIDHEKNTQSTQSPKSSSEIVTAEHGLKLLYWPMWSADSQAIDMFVCRPLAGDGGDPFSRSDPSLVAANSTAVTRACTVALNSMIKDGVRAKLVVPIPLAVVLSPNQRLVFQALEKLQDAHRFLYLRTEIVAVPKSVSAASLLTARDLLKPLARDVSILTDLNEPNEAVLAAGKVVIGCDASAMASTSSDILNRDLMKFKNSVQDRPSYVLGLTEKSDITVAANFGFDEIGGPGLRAALRHTPKTTEPLLRDDLVNKT